MDVEETVAFGSYGFAVLLPTWLGKLAVLLAVFFSLPFLKFYRINALVIVETDPTRATLIYIPSGSVFS